MIAVLAIVAYVALIVGFALAVKWAIGGVAA